MRLTLITILLLVSTIGFTQTVKELHTRATFEKYSVLEDGNMRLISSKKGTFSIQFDSTLHISLWDGTTMIASLLILESKMSADHSAEIYNVLLETSTTGKPAVFIIQYDSVIEYYNGTFNEDGTNNVTQCWRFLAC